jgi:hypothetical protein
MYLALDKCAFTWYNWLCQTEGDTTMRSRIENGIRILRGTRVQAWNGYGGECRTVWKTNKLQPDEVVMLESLQGVLSKPLTAGYLKYLGKTISIPCKPMGKILPGRHSHLFDV